ncbi:unnamed protein product [Gongylonema pulchrum]|uniref:Uncharacterized protein n=1 Tax=Gongylonema pulchrum TaxID=637853 RepID=A0A183F097_9BILA|nr:unnamed protein product [Gongylonema pulchrum]
MAVPKPYCMNGMDSNKCTMLTTDNGVFRGDRGGQGDSGRGGGGISGDAPPAATVPSFIGFRTGSSLK